MVDLFLWERRQDPCQLTQERHERTMEGNTGVEAENLSLIPEAMGMFMDVFSCRSNVIKMLLEQQSQEQNFESRFCSFSSSPWIVPDFTELHS